MSQDKEYNPSQDALEALFAKDANVIKKADDEDVSPLKPGQQSQREESLFNQNIQQGSDLPTKYDIDGRVVARRGVSDLDDTLDPSRGSQGEDSQVTPPLLNGQQEFPVGDEFKASLMSKTESVSPEGVQLVETASGEKTLESAVHTENVSDKPSAKTGQSSVQPNEQSEMGGLYEGEAFVVAQGGPQQSSVPAAAMEASESGETASSPDLDGEQLTESGYFAQNGQVGNGNTNDAEKEQPGENVVTNQAPTDITLSGGSVDENSAAGTVVATLNTADPDAGESFSYQLNDPSGNFELDGNQIVVKSGASLDYESQSSYAVEVTVTDLTTIWLPSSSKLPEGSFSW